MIRIERPTPIPFLFYFYAIVIIINIIQLSSSLSQGMHKIIIIIFHIQIDPELRTFQIKKSLKEEEEKNLSLSIWL